MKKEFMVFAISLFAASSAFAAADFKSLDKDSDSNISRSEAKADKDLVGKFSQYDQDKDKVISQQEFSAYEAHEKAETGARAVGARAAVAARAAAKAARRAAGPAVAALVGAQAASNGIVHTEAAMACHCTPSPSLRRLTRPAPRP
jgi:hypothetical protein